MNRRQAISTLAGLPLAAQSQQQRPNMVFVLVDDLRWDALGILGHPFVKTPNIDRIAKEGVIFKNAFVTTPLCSPARGSFLTGQFVRTHGVKGNGDNAALSHKMITWPRLLHDAGYNTGYIGKWHMGTDDSPRPGFDRWVSFKGQGRYDNPPMNFDGKEVNREGYMTDLLSDAAVEFVKQKRDKPFAMYVAHKAIHGPFTPAARHANLFNDQQIKRAPGTTPGVGPNDDLIKNQMRCLTSIDDGVGRIIAALEEQKTFDNTLFVFTSDNGYFWGEHGLGDKRAPYDESIRIPMFARWPKVIRPGSTNSELVLNIDIAPTMLDAAGVKKREQFQGLSLVPTMRGARKRHRGTFLCEYYEEAQYGRIKTWEAVRSDRYKYVRYPGPPENFEFFDLKEDPYEMKNLASSGGKEMEALKKQLAMYTKEVGAL